MAIHDPKSLATATVPITGRRLTPPEGPIFNLHRAADSDYELGEFRAWAGYKDLGTDAATAGLAHFQHVVSFSGTEAAGRTGIHAHFAHAHIVIPTSGRGVFSYDGVVTEAVPGVIIAQHGGTVHDQFSYSFAANAGAHAPVSVDPVSDAAAESFGFLELFVPRTFANVEIVPPDAVSEADQRTAWDHPYHAPGASFFIQDAADADATYRPVAGREDLEARDAGTWRPTAGLVATWIIRPAATSKAPAIRPEAPGETGGIDILFMAKGSASFARDGGEAVHLSDGDTLTCSQGLVGNPFDGSPDMRLVKFFVAAKAQLLRERTPDEIAQLEALGPDIVTRRELRPEGDSRPVNFLRDA